MRTLLILIVILATALISVSSTEVAQAFDIFELIDQTGSNETVVQTNVNVRATTGGNSANGTTGTDGTAGQNGGTITTGDYSVKVHVDTIVNGEVVPPIDIEATGTTSTSTYQQIKTDHSTTTISIETNHGSIDYSSTTPTATLPLVLESKNRAVSPDYQPVMTQLYQHIESMKHTTLSIAAQITITLGNALDSIFHFFFK